MKDAISLLLTSPKLPTLALLAFFVVVKNHHRSHSGAFYADVTQICIPHNAVTYMFMPVSGFLCCYAIVHYIKSFLFLSVSIRWGHERVLTQKRD